MGIGILPPFLGRYLSIVITPQDVDTDGTLTDNALGAHSFNGRLDTLEDEITLDTENISPINALQKNPVIFEQGATYTINELLFALPMVDDTHDAFGFAGVLMAVSRASFYHKLVITPQLADGATAIETETLYGLLSTPRARNIAKGKCTMRAVFQTVLIADTTTGAYIANPTYS